jgi:hypothetical protein
MAVLRHLAEKNQFDFMLWRRRGSWLTKKSIRNPNYGGAAAPQLKTLCAVFLNASSSQALMGLSAPAHRTS